MRPFLFLSIPYSIMREKKGELSRSRELMEFLGIDGGEGKER